MSENNIRAFVRSMGLQALRPFLHGIEKGYTFFSWLEKPDRKEYYITKIENHMRYYKDGEMQDKDSGLHPLEHVLANVMILMHCEIMKGNNKRED